MTPRKTQPVLLGGAFIGVLSALPIISVGNLFCCLWIVGGGVIAAYLMQQSHPEAITLQDGAVGGFLAGIVGAFVYVIVAVPVQLLMAPIQRRVAQGILDAARTVPPELRDHDRGHELRSGWRHRRLDDHVLRLAGSRRDLRHPWRGPRGADVSTQPPTPNPLVVRGESPASHQRLAMQRRSNAAGLSPWSGSPTPQPPTPIAGPLSRRNLA